jgi:hypothetical protein
MGDSFSQDRIFVRKQFGKFKTILDAGCGACPEYNGIINIYPNIKYTGLDITSNLVEYNMNNNIVFRVVLIIFHLKIIHLILFTQGMLLTI